MRTVAKKEMARALGTKERFLVVCFAFLICCSTTILRAQTGTATLSGTVMDPSGRVVPGVGISATNVDTNVATNTKTNEDGIYVFPALTPGRYRIIVTKQGFKQIALTDVTLSTQASVSRNFDLEVGAVSETVTISGDTERMANDNPAVGLLVNRDFIENMPLNGRSFQDLIALAPGAVSSVSGSGLYSINGQREDANYFTVDGVAANVNTNPIAISGGNLSGISGTQPAQTALGTTQSLASLDALQEFKVQTSTYSAEYGRQPGGQIELTTRSGTNSIHGSLFDYFRNEALDANDWFFNEQGIARQPLRQNDFGGTFGGPVEIPKVYDGKDKTFFFVSYEGLRLIQPVFSGVQDEPTMAFRQFSSTTIQPYLDSTPLPNGPENGDQCALSVGQTFSCTAQWSAAYSQPSDLHALNVRLDQVIARKLQLFARYSNTPSHLTTFNTSEARSSFNNTHSWTVGATWNAASNLVNEFRVNYTESNGGVQVNPTAFSGAVPYPRSLILFPQNAPPGTQAAGEPVNIFSGSPESPDPFYLPTYQNQKAQQSQLNLVDGFSFTKGRHDLKFGVDFRRLSPTVQFSQYAADIFFASLGNYQQGTTSFSLALVEHAAHPVFLNSSLYVQDHWKISQRLTFDYGLRWEYNPAPGASDGIYPLALTSSNPAIAEIAPQGTPQYHTTYHNFAPRIGFAYSALPNPNHSLVVRGGFGIFYDTGQNLGVNGYLGYPFSAFTINTNQLSLPLTAADLAPPVLTFPVMLITPYGPLNGINDPNLTLPYTEQWNLSLDYGLSSRNTLTASYVGNVGRRLLFTENFFGTGTLFDPNLTENGLSYTNNGALSNYNGFQLQDQGYLAPGMQLVASYTWAHAIDNASFDQPFNPPFRGNSDNDIRNAFNLAMNYRIPMANSDRFTRALTKGWSIDTRFVAQSGYPLDIFQGSYTLPNGATDPIKPDLVLGVPIYEHGVKGVLGGWALNPAAFTPVPTDPVTGAPLQPSTLGRNFVHGPAFWNLNTAVQRDFAIRDRLVLVFRVEAFNLFNHPNAGNIDTSLFSSTFGISNPGGFGGVPTIGVPNMLYASGAPRSLQILLKIQF